MSFTQAEYPVEEDDGVVRVCVELMTGPELIESPITAIIFGIATR